MGARVPRPRLGDGLGGLGSPSSGRDFLAHGALALGASIVELDSASPAFDLVRELLQRQPPFAGGSGVAVSVLRVLQCCSHLTAQALGATSSQPAAPELKGGGAAAPRLAFVLGDDLLALSAFVRSGLRMVDHGGLPGRGNSLLLTDQLDVHSCWHGGRARAQQSKATRIDATGTVHGQPESKGEITPALRIWRLVLAVCWPNRALCQGDPLQPIPLAEATAAATPAFIIDYAVEALSAQLTVS